MWTLDPLRKLPLPTAAVLDHSTESSGPPPGAARAGVPAVLTSVSSSVAGELPAALLPPPPLPLPLVPPEEPLVLPLEEVGPPIMAWRRAATALCRG